jgi:hypothetical protein
MHRALCILAMVLLGLLLTWKLVAELIEPHFLLWLFPRSSYLEVPALENSRLRLYQDTRPFVGKIAGLQKGLVWIWRGRALIEEGYGFGCPIIVHQDRPFVSQHAAIQIARDTPPYRLIKRYDIDTIDTPIQVLRRKYQPVPSLGTVTFQYDIDPSGIIDVTVDLTDLTVDWQRVYLMNEQGARRFTRYYDAEGRHLSAEQIGIWEPSSTFISRACFEQENSSLGFCVEPERPATVYYGRERYNQYNWRGIFYLSWSGVDIELTAPRSVYHYRIVLEVQ